MGHSTRFLAGAAILIAATLPLTAAAWRSPPAGVVPIAEVREHAEIGDYMVVEGVVLDRTRDGIFEIEDGTGRMLILIPDFVTRAEGVPEKSEHIRVAGKYDDAKLDESVQGIHVMTLWRGRKVSGARGRTPKTAPATSPAPTAGRVPPAAASHREGDEVHRPTASPEMVQKLSAARREWLAAIAELEAASTAYGRALFEAGKDGVVDPKIVERNDTAERRVARASERIPVLVEEARRAGVSEDVLRLYVQMTKRHP